MRRDIRSVQNDFIRDYMNTEPYKKYVRVVAISDVGVQEWLNSGMRGNQRNSGEPCLFVQLNPLPQGVEIPERYNGIRIYTQVIEGEIELMRV